MKKILSLFCILLFIIEMDAQTFEWTKSFGGTLKDGGTSIAVDASGNVYTIGQFKGTADFDPGVGVVNLTANGSSSFEDFFIQKLDVNGNYIWAKSIGGGGADLGSSITVDTAGNVYVIGSFRSQVDFDPGVGTAILTSAGSYDIFILKLDSAGNFIWAKSIGASSLDYGFSIFVDDFGNIYTTGRFRETVDFDPGIGTSNLTSVGVDDVFVQKLDNAGNFIWAKSFGGSSGDQGTSIAVDAEGNVYTTGFFIGVVDFDPGPDTANQTGAGLFDGYVHKLDSNGNFQWAITFGASNWDLPNSIAVDDSGNVYTTGSFVGTVDFNPGPGVFNLTPVGASDAFILKLNPNGNFIWAKRFGGKDGDVSYSISMDTANNIYTTGSFKDRVDFNPGGGTYQRTSKGGSDAFVQKLDPNGNFLWARSFGGTQNDIGNCITVDATGNVYTIGTFEGTASLDPVVVATANYTSLGETDIYVQKMNQFSNIGIPGTPIHQGITVFPNPTQGAFTIDLGSVYESTQITIRDGLGRIIATSRHMSTSTISISLDEPPGIYFIEIKSDDTIVRLKLMQQ